MAKYGVNLPSSQVESESQVEPPASEEASFHKGRQAFLPCLFAVAVAVTPEFSFLGIPKVRITDLLLPFLMLSYLGSIAKDRSAAKGKDSKFYSLCCAVICWDLAALLLWGKAHFAPGIFYLAKRVIYFLIALFVGGCVRSVRAWQTVIRLLVYVSPVLNFFVLRELRAMEGLGGVYATTEGMRASGIIANQQTSTALFVVIVTCLVLGCWDAFRDATWRIATLVALFSGCAAVLATGSRGGMACLVLSVVVYSFLNPEKVGKAVVGGLVVGCVGWLVTPGAIQGRLSSVFAETQGTLNGLLVDRSLMPDAGGSSVAGRAVTAEWFFQDIMPQAGLLGLGAGWKSLGALDDFYLTEWMYHGFIGLLLFLRLQWALLVYCVRTARQANDPAERGAASGVATAVFVMSASCIHGDTFYLIRPMECLALLVGLVFARKKISS